MGILRDYHNAEVNLMKQLGQSFGEHFPLTPELTDGQQSIIASFASELPVKDRAEFRTKVLKALAVGQINDQRLVRVCLDALSIP
jgi:hypothetical protein